MAEVAQWLVLLAIHGTVKLHYIYRSSHSFKPKSWIHVETHLSDIQPCLFWFTLGTVSSHALYAYVGLLLTCLIFLSAIDRKGLKRGRRWLLLSSRSSLFTWTVTFAVIFLVAKGMQHVAAAKYRGATFSDLFTNVILPNLSLPLLAYTLSRQLFIYVPPCLDPWCIITSFIQHTLLAPSYINTLNVYAGRTSLFLGSLIDRTVPSSSCPRRIVGNERRLQDINAVCEGAIYVLSTKLPKEEKWEDVVTKQEDYYL
ncbi:hypothetical protein EDB83DRAFT_2528957 [Lactarius deliciosus]|nr:hypothetical protein EDB83DRAFT_2528957 [Lactarius deliciosus]